MLFLLFLAQAKCRVLPAPASFIRQAWSSIVPQAVRIAGPKWGPNQGFRVPRAHGFSRGKRILHWGWLFRAGIFKRQKAFWRRYGPSYILKVQEKTTSEEAGKHVLVARSKVCLSLLGPRNRRGEVKR